MLTKTEAAEVTIDVYLPDGLVGEIKVKPGDRVRENEELFNGEVGANFLAVNLAERLGCQAAEIGKFLKVSLGDQVKANDLLAEKKQLWRLKREFAPAAGKVAHLDKKTGDLLIQVGGRTALVKAPVGGVVEAVNERGIRLRFRGRRLFARLGHGKVSWGPLRVGSRPGRRLRGEEIGVDNAGEVLLVGDIGREGLAKAAAVSLAGVVCGFMEEELFRDLEAEILRKFDLPFLVLFKDSNKIDEDLLRDIYTQIGKQVIVDADKKSLTFPLEAE